VKLREQGKLDYAIAIRQRYVFDLKWIIYKVK